MSRSQQEMERDQALSEIRDMLAGLGDAGIISLNHRHLDVIGKLPPITKEDELAGLGTNNHKGGGGGRDVYVADLCKAFKKITAIPADPAE